MTPTGVKCLLPCPGLSGATDVTRPSTVHDPVSTPLEAMVNPLRVPPHGLRPGDILDPTSVEGSDRKRDAKGFLEVNERPEGTRNQDPTH